MPSPPQQTLHRTWSGMRTFLGPLATTDTHLSPSSHPNCNTLRAVTPKALSSTVPNATTAGGSTGAVAAVVSQGSMEAGNNSHLTPPACIDLQYCAGVRQGGPGAVFHPGRVRPVKLPRKPRCESLVRNADRSVTFVPAANPSDVGVDPDAPYPWELFKVQDIVAASPQPHQFPDGIEACGRADSDYSRFEDRGQPVSIKGPQQRQVHLKATKVLQSSAVTSRINGDNEYAKEYYTPASSSVVTNSSSRKRKLGSAEAV